MSQFKVSVVIRCYNEEKHLGRLLEGLARQTVRNPEIIVVDSGSTDASPAIATSYGAKVIGIPKVEFSFGRSLNLGCAQASGQVIVAISAHCYPVYSDWLERLLAPFSDPRIAMTYGKQRGNQFTRFSEHRIFRQWFGDETVLFQSTPFANNANSAFRSNVWRAKPFNETLTGLEDLDWAHRIMQDGQRIAYVAEAPVIHVHEESWAQIYNRYRREAIALRRILPHERFGLIDLLTMLITSIGLDIRDAGRQHILSKEFAGIFLFRWQQYLGTFRGHRQRDEINEKLRQTFYYPVSSPTSTEKGKNTGPHTQVPIDYSSRSASPEGVWKFRAKETNKVRRNDITLIDISVPLDRPLPIWPGDPYPKITRVQSLNGGDPATVSTLSMCVHSGTHIDAPSHFLAGAATIGDISLRNLIGPVYVVQVESNLIDASILRELDVPSNCNRILFKTKNSALWRKGPEIRKDYVALTPDAAHWLVEHAIILVGIDYLSIERFGEPNNRTHKILLEAGMIILEGLNLIRVTPGNYNLICLPLSLENAEGAPARALLEKV